MVKPPPVNIRPLGPIRRIAHLDMDAFYASVELLRYPQLKDLPVVIGGGRANVAAALEVLRQQAQLDAPELEWDAGAQRAALGRIPLDAFARLADYTGRGVITTATYAARPFGVGSAMGLMKAAKLCPQAILLPVDFEEYRRYSRQFKSIITEIAPHIEDRGVDEVYIDFTDVPGGQREGGRVLARLIQKAVFEATGLTCSIGVAPNKLLAKMASEFNKPRGISVVFEEDVRTQIWPLACRKMNGIGPKADEKLKGFGIETIGQLAERDLQWLMNHFGPRTGAWLHAASHGQDERPVVTESEPVSLSRETTFERDLHAVRDRAELGAVFTRLCEQVAADLQRKGYAGKTIGIKLKFDDFSGVTRDITVAQYTSDAKTIRQLAGQCLKRAPLQKKLRLLGVRVGTLLSQADLPSSVAKSATEAVDIAGEAPEFVAINGELF